MHVLQFARAVDFVDQTVEWLERDEAANSLMLGLVLRQAANAADSGFWALVIEDQQPILAAILSRHSLILSSVEAPSAALELAPELPAPLPTNRLIGPPATTHALAAALEANGQTGWKLGMDQRIYTLRTVTPPDPQPSGELRVATSEHTDLLVQWITAFHTEALDTVQSDSLQTLVEAKIEAGDLFLWWDGEQPVSLAARNRPTRHTYTVNTVYTPPELRRKGYASATVAALSQRLLDAGSRECCLYTDLSNPTSNSIYQAIGYYPVADSSEWIREEPAS